MNGTLVRIWTEDLNLDRIKVEVGHYFSAYTIFSASGVWDGTSENSLVIEILVPEGPYHNTRIGYVRNIAEFIKALNNQKAVLVTRTPVESELI